MGKLPIATKYDTLLIVLIGSNRNFIWATLYPLISFTNLQMILGKQTVIKTSEISYMVDCSFYRVSF
jgi:hypothetical protein